MFKEVLTSIKPTKLFFVLIIFEVALAISYLYSSQILPTSSITHWVNLDEEKNIPAIFSSLQLIFVGVVLIKIRAISPKVTAIGFLYVIGWLFIFLGIDEGLQIHERITRYFKHIDWLPRFEGDHGAWVLPYVLLAFVIFLLSIGSIINLLKNETKHSLMMGSGVLILLVSALGLEVASYLYIRGQDLPDIYYILQVATEELGEMVGVSIVLCSALDLLQKRRL
ncbi:hypothetical protein AAEU29_16240 [Pseudoalteromonas sp. SSM20]|uniref:hypothetical protein n=1 Tax=Pseudoalteromonas sp. SSM20 TaxID=3139394 RepID=UPI003BAC4EBB